MQGFGGEGKRLPGKPRGRWEDNIKKRSLRFGVGKQELVCSGSVQGQVSGTCECGNEPSGSTKCGEFLD